MLTIDVSIAHFLAIYRYTCAATTIWSGASYIYTKDAVKILYPPKK
jgi:cardiolipin synthase